ncbi:hypothetical protein GUJ93_ZPchr0004g39604 [Zizania palustris]|uniref:Uncharacterized protein n=1 Tax=Zizania palustris TaxID=103762 RepID=A0A8J5SHF2_ZIZPA|nr:hypothetical protein GUJ93_ZPchr0004g39604 [Zizania palustris]
MVWWRSGGAWPSDAAGVGTGRQSTTTVEVLYGSTTPIASVYGVLGLFTFGISSGLFLPIIRYSAPHVASSSCG